MSRTAGLRAWPLLLALVACQPPTPEVVSFPDAACDAAGVCQSRRDGRGITLRFLAPPSPLKAFPFEVRLRGFPADPPPVVRVRFEMPDMEMGLNRYRLEAAGAGRFTGRAVLPVCTTGRHDWRAVVSVEGTEAIREARFVFRVGD